MNEYPKGNIYKLFVGFDQKTYFEVGKYNEIIDATVVKIMEDTNYFEEVGIKKFIIIVKSKETQLDWVWTDVEGFPFRVQYAKPNGVPQNII